MTTNTNNKLTDETLKAWKTEAMISLGETPKDCRDYSHHEAILALVTELQERRKADNQEPAPIVPEECPTELLAFCEQVIDSRITANAKADELWNACRAAMLHGAEPVSNHDELALYYLQGQKDGLEWAAQLAEANHPYTGDWLYDDPLELAKAIRKGPDMPEFAGSSPVIQEGWTGSDEANAALIMLDRIETVDSVDDDRIEGIKRIIRGLAAAPQQ